MRTTEDVVEALNFACDEIYGILLRLEEDDDPAVVWYECKGAYYLIEARWRVSRSMRHRQVRVAIADRAVRNYRGDAPWKAIGQRFQRHIPSARLV